MKGLIQFSIPVQGLRDGTHQFDFQLDRSFFAHFEDSPVADGSIRLQLIFDNRPDMKVLLFDFEGTVRSNCDRCLAPIDLPVEGKAQLILKMKQEGEDELDDPDVVYISADDQKIDIAPHVYEFVCLALPMIKVYDCEEDDPVPCDEQMLDYLEQSEETEQSNPIWEDLKKQFNQSDE
jgi:uncharacterized protein